MANQYSDKTWTYMMGIYKKFGVAMAVMSGFKMIESPTHKYDKDFQSGVHGEVCEAVLEIMLREFIQKNKIKDWYLSKSLVLVDDKGMTTELDITLFTPKCIYIFECKCYYGDKRITDVCTIEREGQKAFDVFAQNSFHKDMVNRVFSGLRYVESSYKQDIQLVLFDFSKGSVKDLRCGDSKNLMPITNINNVYSIFNNYKGLPIQWDISSLVEVIKVYEENHDELMKTHLKRLKKKYK